MAAALADEAVDHRQAKARALAEVLRREERLENPLADVVRDPDALVGDLEHDGLSGMREHVRERLVIVAGGEPRAHGDRSAIGHRIARVDDQVEDDLLHLPAVGRDRRKPRRQIHVERVFRSEQAREHLLHVADDGGELERLGLQHLLAAEREELTGESGRAVARAEDVVERLALRIVGGSSSSR